MKNTLSLNAPMFYYFWRSGDQIFSKSRTHVKRYFTHSNGNNPGSVWEEDGNKRGRSNAAILQFSNAAILQCCNSTMRKYCKFIIQKKGPIDFRNAWFKNGHLLDQSKKQVEGIERWLKPLNHNKTKSCMFIGFKSGLINIGFIAI